MDGGCIRSVNRPVVGSGVVRGAIGTSKASKQHTMSSVRWTVGDTAGGDTVRIFGTRFSGATNVKFGSDDAASFTVVSPRIIEAVTPAHASGLVSVTVQKAGADDVTLANAFRFWTPTDIDAAVRLYRADAGVTSATSTTLRRWNVRRVDRDWGDYIERDGASMTFFGDVAYLFGGWQGTGQAEWNNQKTTNEIWKTEDFGLSWHLVAAHDDTATDRPSRRHTPGQCRHTVGGIDYWYIIGGDLEDTNYSGGHSDVWRTANGVTWEKMAEHGTPGWNGRNLVSVGSLNGKLYLLGGASDPDGVYVQYGDMWESTDGAVWTQTMSSTPMGVSLAAGELLTHDSKLWLICGGFLTSATNGVWSFDGTSWTEVLADGHAQFAKRFYNNQVVFDGEMYLICGEGSDGVNLVNVYRSSDGATWAEVTGASFSASHAVAIASHDDGILFATGNAMSRGAHFMRKETGTLVSAWTDQGSNGKNLSQATDANKPLLVDGRLAIGKKTIYFNGDDYLKMTKETFGATGGSMMAAGVFLHYDITPTSDGTYNYTPPQTIIGTDTSACWNSWGLYGWGTESRQNVNLPFSSRFRQAVRAVHDGKPTSVACYQKADNTTRQFIHGEQVGDDSVLAYSTANAGWSAIGTGYLPGNDGLVGHLFAVAVIPGVLIGATDVAYFDEWAKCVSGAPIETDPLETVAADQLLLKDGELAHYSEAEWALHSHLLKDFSTDYRSGDAIPGYAQSHSLTGNGSTRYAEISFDNSSEAIGRYENAIEIELSFKTPATNGSSTGIISHANSTQKTWALTLSSAYKLEWWHNTKLHTGTTVLSPSTWYRLKVVKTGSTGAWVVNLYINGVLDSTLNTSDDAAIYSSTVTRLLSVHNAMYSAGSVSDVRLTYDGKNYRIPICEGGGLGLYWFETISERTGTDSAAVASGAMWGTFTEESSMCRNWLLQYGGYNAGTFGAPSVPSLGGDTAANGELVNMFPSRFMQPNTSVELLPTLDCDPLGLAAASLGLEAALAPDTERNSASGHKRRRRYNSGFADRIGAKSNGMDSATADDYFGD